MTGPSTRGGLTLVEVVVSTAVLSVLLLGVSSCIAQAQRSDALAREREAATRAALQEIEDRVMVCDTDAQFDAILALDVPFSVAYQTGAAAVPLPPARVSPNAGGVGRLQVTTVAAGAFNGRQNLLQARAVVRWRSATGADAEVVVACLKARS